LIVPPTMPLSKAVQLLKGSSSKHLNETRVVAPTSRGRKGTARLASAPRRPRASWNTLRTNRRIMPNAATKKNSSSS
jgi:hypothetical protein